ncbi:hypothetical protein DNK56_19785 [Streptomyces sp. AC1-42W]|nr:hypothetical protein DNK56_19785 [Streptomyces sp. AC1-42W]
MEITDTASDGHHARARFVSVTANGKRKYWAWHYNYGGPGTVVVETTAQDTSSGIIKLGIQAARAEKSTVLNSCLDLRSP